MSKKSTIIVLVVVAVVVVVLSFNGAGLDGDSGAVQTPATSGGQAVVYTDEGFSPGTMIVRAGTAVIFRNESSRSLWPASAVHPTHEVYPGSAISKCGTADEAGIFDSCGRIQPGNEWSFTFNAPGSWKYHDHLSSGFSGTIEVQ